MSAGDYVAYDAGVWSETKEKPTSLGEFGGYTSGQNKGNSVEYCYDENSKTALKGWRVLSKSGTTVTLVHAGISECYYHTSGGASSFSVKTLKNRATSTYLNSTYASSVHMMTYEEAENITGSKDKTTNDLRYIGLSGTTYNSAYYWLATASDVSSLYNMSNFGSILYSSIGSFGIRPVIVLKDNIKTTGKGKDVFGQDAWTLVAS